MRNFFSLLMKSFFTSYLFSIASKQFYFLFFEIVKFVCQAQFLIVLINLLSLEEVEDFIDFENFRFAEIYNDSLILKFKIWWWNLPKIQRQFYITVLLMFALLFTMIILMILLVHTSADSSYQ